MTTPMMQQWRECKDKAPGALLLFRLGDFYEAFYEDAPLLSQELDLTLTKRQEIPMAGIPHMALEGALEKLVQRGHLVAIAEQIEDPKAVKGLVKRDIVRIVSPATHLSPTPSKPNNYLACLTQLGSLFGLSLLDISTGEFLAIEIESRQDLLDELAKRSPKELLVAKKCLSHHQDLLRELSMRIEAKEDWHFDHKSCYEALTRHFNVHTLDGFGLRGVIASINAAGALLTHVRDRLCLDISHIRGIQTETLAQFMAIDRATHSHLELDQLFHFLDRCQTPMGSRLLKKWITHPLVDVAAIEKRQKAIQSLLLSDELSIKLKHIRDLDRLSMRIATGNASPRDLIGLAHSLDQIPDIRQALPQTPYLASIEADLIDVSAIVDQIKQELHPEPPTRLSDGRVMRVGIFPELDQLRALHENSHQFLTNYQNELRDKLGIKTLRVTYSKAFGYSIEVSRGQSAKMGEGFYKQQTLVNTERFISSELKEFEQKILGAEERIHAIETHLFHDLRRRTAAHLDAIRTISSAIAQLDLYLALASIAHTYGYICPQIDKTTHLQIEGGRHPLIEVSLKSETFIANDTSIDEKEQRLLLITGPNMAGKSTYIRQVALLVIMSQVGSFIPARSARIGIVDKLFTRIGASDDLARGQSTFMVEMTETANILNNATDRSLVILDEIGRGTSTYDGISIAWSVADYLLSVKRPRTLFATHYFELTELEKGLKGAVNYNVAVEETVDGIVFLRKIVRGTSDRSYGIHVAKLAGLPASVIQQAQTRLAMLEATHVNVQPMVTAPPKEEQLSLFSLQPPKWQGELDKIDPNQLTPLQALELLVKWKQDV